MYIFQLHYGPDSTKEEGFIFLDKACDPKPLVITASQTHTTTPTTESTIETKAPATPIEETTNFPENSPPKDEKKNTAARRPLFQNDKGKAETPVAKRTKKED